MSDPWAEFKKGASVEVVKFPPKKTSPKKEPDAWAEFKTAPGVVTETLFDKLMQNPMGASQDDLDKLPKELRDKVAEASIAQYQGISYEDLQDLKNSPLAKELSDPRSYQLPPADQILPQLGQNLGVAARGAVQGAASPIGMVVDPIAQLFNLPSFSQSLENTLTQAGVPEAKTAVQRIMQNTVAGMAGSGAYTKAGQALAAGGGLQPSAVQGIGQTMAQQPGMNLASGAAGGEASQTLAEMGAPPIAQMAAGLGASIGVGAGMQPGALGLLRGDLSDADLGTLVKKASGGNIFAQKKLASMAKINTEAKAEADKLGIELPADVFSDNPQIRSAAGLTRSVAASPAEGEWRTTISNAVDRADEVMREAGTTFAGGQPSTSVVSQKVKDSLLKSRDELQAQAAEIYSRVDEAVPKPTKVQLTNLKRVIDEIRGEVGGDAGLSPTEKKLYAMVTEQNPTYGRLIREKNVIGEAIGKSNPLFGDMDSATLKRIYGAMAEDQLASVDKVGGKALGEELRAANLAYGKVKDLGDVLVDAYGKDLSGGIGAKMEAALTQSKDPGAFNALMKTVPEDLRQEVIATTLASLSRSKRGAERGGFGFSEYANTFEGIMRNKDVADQVFKALGPDSFDTLRGLYTVSKRITDARANVLSTGKANQAMAESMTAEGLFTKVLDSAIVRTGTTVLGAAGGGPAGAGLAAAGQALLSNALSKGKRDVLKSAGNLFNSAKFQQLAVEAATKPNVPVATIAEVARSPEFAAFASKAKIPREQRFAWIANAVNPSLLNQPKENKTTPLSALEASRLKKAGNE